jgi:hypothetical protein
MIIFRHLIGDNVYHFAVQAPHNMSDVVAWRFSVGHRARELGRTSTGLLAEYLGISLQELQLRPEMKVSAVNVERMGKPKITLSWSSQQEYVDRKANLEQRDAYQQGAQEMADTMCNLIAQGAALSKASAKAIMEDLEILRECARHAPKIAGVAVKVPTEKHTRGVMQKYEQNYLSALPTSSNQIKYGRTLVGDSRVPSDQVIFLGSLTDQTLQREGEVYDVQLANESLTESINTLGLEPTRISVQGHGDGTVICYFSPYTG